MKTADITAIVLTHNESKHIGRCIDSLIPITSAIVVVDSYSTDDTLDIARAKGATIYQNPWINYATQFQWALDHAEISTEWVMRIDADEYLEAESAPCFATIASLGKHITGIVIKRKYYFLGRWMRYGGMHPIYHLKIWRHGTGNIENKWMDERIVLKHGSSVNMDISIVDDNLNNLTWWIGKHNGYATREMIDTLNLEYRFLHTQSDDSHSGSAQSTFKRFVKEKIYSKSPLFVRPLCYFLFRYFVQLGFLDGKRGLIFHFLHAFWYRLLVDAKIYEAKTWIEHEKNGDNIKQILRNKTSLDI